MQKRNNFNSDKKQRQINSSKKQIYRPSNKKENYIPRDEGHSSVFSKEGLKSIIYKYNSIKSENKTMTTDDQLLSKNTMSRNKKEDSDKLTSLTKLKELNSNMDLILTGMKDKYENNMNNDKKILNADQFMNQIKNDKSNISDINDIYSISNMNSYYKYKNSDNYNNNYNNNYNYIYNNNYELKIKKYHNLSITNYNFSIIKKYLIYNKDLNQEEQVKLKSIFNNINDIGTKNKNKDAVDLNEIINKFYDYKNKYESLKNKNELSLSEKSYDENKFNKICKKHFESNKYEYNNEIIRKEIEILKENLAKSLYDGEMLLNRYYDKLKKYDSNLQNNIDDLTDDVLEKKKKL